MLRRDLHAPPRKRFGTQSSPGFELRAVRLVLDPANHEIRQVAELVCEDVEQAVLVVDDFFGKLDGSVMSVRCLCRAVQGTNLRCLTTPVRATGGGVERFAPDEADAAC